MKKLIIVFLAMLAVGCGRTKNSALQKQHVFHTYYGDIDIDTMEVAGQDVDNHDCYVVNRKGKDTIYYYIPDKNTYFVQIPSCNEYGNVTIDFDPQTNKDY
ncbi:MAG: hypothetical protein IJV29_07025 [Butyrivibrio sp.]|nr:hypothetical protein [Butyrivibrio sp.]